MVRSENKIRGNWFVGRIVLVGHEMMQRKLHEDFWCPRYCVKVGEGIVSCIS